MSQRRLYEEIKKVGKPIVFVNVSGSCINLSDQNKNCNAVIQCFYPGAEGGNALADVLFGRVNPSGRLPVTFYKSTDDLPPFEDYSMGNRTYRFFKGDVVYPFGYGLSYSTFEYQDDETHDGKMTLTVKNTGNYDGKVVVKVYDSSKTKRLIGFTKVFIEKSASKQVEVKLLYAPEKYIIEL